MDFWPGLVGTYIISFLQSNSIGLASFGHLQRLFYDLSPISMIEGIVLQKLFERGLVERRLGLFDELEIVLPLEKLLLHVVLLEGSHKISQRGGFDYHHYLLL